MGQVLYDRIKQLCDEHETTIKQLERDLGFANARILKWKAATSPPADKVLVVAQHFGVSVDYLLGASEIPLPADKILDDPDIISLQKAKLKKPDDYIRMMQMLRVGFDYAFQDDNEFN